MHGGEKMLNCIAERVAGNDVRALILKNPPYWFESLVSAPVLCLQQRAQMNGKTINNIASNFILNTGVFLLPPFSAIPPQSTRGLFLRIALATLLYFCMPSSTSPPTQHSRQYRTDPVNARGRTDFWLNICVTRFITQRFFSFLSWGFCSSRSQRTEKLPNSEMQCSFVLCLKFAIN